MDDDAAMGRVLGEVAVVPHARKPGEVGVAVLLAVRIVPEHQRHRGERVAAHQLALAGDERPAVLVKTSTSRPSALAWISPRHTGPSGLPSTRQPHRSVPPEIEAR
jgi:hypothetical protein